MKLTTKILILVLIIIGCRPINKSSNSKRDNYLKLIGKYCSPPNLGGYCYELFPTKKFKYASRDCVGPGVIGHGNYSYINKILSLEFLPIPKPTDPENHISCDTIELIQSGYKVELNAFDEDSKEGLRGLNIIVKDEQSPIFGYSTDFDGNANFELDDIEDPLELEFSYLGYSTTKLVLLTPGIYNIKLGMNSWPDFQGRIENETRKYHVLKVHSDKIVLKNIKGGEGFSLNRILPK